MRDHIYNIEHRAGRKNEVADHLSRPVRVLRYHLEEHWLGKAKEEFKQVQRDEPKWRKMVEYLESGQIPRSKYPRATLHQFTVEEEIPYLVQKNIHNTFKYVLVLPEELRKAALELIHCKVSGHLGHKKKSILKCEEYFYLPNLKQDVIICKLKSCWSGSRGGGLGFKPPP